MKDFKTAVEEAKKMHWGTYCKCWNVCEEYGICSVACPNGGIDGNETVKGGENNGNA